MEFRLNLLCGRNDRWHIIKVPFFANLDVYKDLRICDKALDGGGKRDAPFANGAEQQQALTRFGAILGEAFQIADDLLDVEGDAATVGKATGKDAEAGKATAVSILGVAKAKEKLFGLIDQAEQLLAPFGERADVLKAAARFVAERRA